MCGSFCCPYRAYWLGIGSGDCTTGVFQLFLRDTSQHHWSSPGREATAPNTQKALSPRGTQRLSSEIWVTVQGAPGEKTPPLATVTLPPMVPMPARVPPLLTVTPPPTELVT